MKQGELRGYVLAGGESSRMRGHGLPLDKASIVWNGQTLLERATTLLLSVCEAPAVLCGTSERCARIHLQNSGVIDRFQGMGPLGGLEAALADAASHGASRVLVVPVDLPCLTPELLLAFVPCALAQQSSACCLRSRARTQPLPALVHVDALPFVQEALLAGHRKLLPVLSSVAQRLSPQVGLAMIEAVDLPGTKEDDSWFWNVNTPEELQLLQQGESLKTAMHQSTHGK